MRSAASIPCGGDISRSSALRRATAAASRSRSAASACRAAASSAFLAAIRFCSASSRAISPVSARSLGAQRRVGFAASAPRRAAARPAAHRRRRPRAGRRCARCRSAPSSRACSARLSARPRRLASASLPSRSISCRIAASAPLALLRLARRGDRFPARRGELFGSRSRLGRRSARRPSPRDLRAPAASAAPARRPGQSRRRRAAAFRRLGNGGSTESQRLAPGASQRAGAAPRSAPPRPQPATPSGRRADRASVRRKASLGRTPLIRHDQRMPGHRRRLRQAENVEQGRRDIGEPAVARCGRSRAGGLTTMNGTGFSVCAVCGSPVSGSRIISALP